MAKVKQIAYRFDPNKFSHKVLIGVPTLGRVRLEWARALSAMTIPTSWHQLVLDVYNSQVAEARNEIVSQALKNKVDWVFFIDDDVILPPDTLRKLRAFMDEGKYPVVYGLYYLKSSIPEPLIYRGRGVGPYYNWKHGDKVWTDGTPMGCNLIHTSLFRKMSPPWFESPRNWIPGTEVSGDGYTIHGGTEDLFWCDRVINEGIIEKAGWKVPDPKNPFLCDTSIFCQHIDLNTGLMYPQCCDDQWKRLHENGRHAEQERLALAERNARYKTRRQQLEESKKRRKKQAA